LISGYPGPREVGFSGRLASPKLVIFQVGGRGGSASEIHHQHPKSSSAHVSMFPPIPFWSPSRFKRKFRRTFLLLVLIAIPGAPPSAGPARQVAAGHRCLQEQLEHSDGWVGGDASGVEPRHEIA
ncbi:hypothetical protein Vafri_15524, partial [Volvox africanus]